MTLILVFTSIILMFGVSVSAAYFVIQSLLDIGLSAGVSGLLGFVSGYVILDILLEIAIIIMTIIFERT